MSSANSTCSIISQRSKEDPTLTSNTENVINWKFDESFNTNNTDLYPNDEKIVDTTENSQINENSVEIDDESILSRGKRRRRPHDQESQKKTKLRDSSQISTINSSLEGSRYVFPNENVKVENGFSVGMSLEAIDPLHPNFFCVVNVSAVSGTRIRLRFDGYSDCFDFWVGINSPFIFPPGWCQRNGKKLQHPSGCDEFEWMNYLGQKDRTAAPEDLFQKILKEEDTDIKIGMKLVGIEFDYPPTLPLRRIATVVEKLGQYFLVGFDGSHHFSGFWATANSPLLVSAEGFMDELEPPEDYQGEFSLEKYLEQTNATLVPASALNRRPPIKYQQKMRVEVVDAYNPDLIRQATIALVREYRLKIHLNGWPKPYDYWVDDDYPFIFPVGHCERYDIRLTLNLHQTKYKNINCGTNICSGLGHASGRPDSRHESLQDCPYKKHAPMKRLNRLIPDFTLDSIPPILSPQHREIPVETSSQITFSSNSVRGSPVPRRRRRKVSRQKNGVCMKSPSIDTRPVTREEIETHFQMEDLFDPPTFTRMKDVSSILQPSVQPRKSEVMMWSCEQVGKFIAGITGSAAGRTFVNNRIDGRALLLIQQDDLTNILKLKLGPSLKIYYHILVFRDSNVLLNPLV